ncbi:MAG: TadE family protein [Bdellovibrionota bacterium]
MKRLLVHSLEPHGTAMLEMVLFTPLALLFLFAAIDVGLFFHEKAALADAVRSGMNVHLASKHLHGIADSYTERLEPESVLGLLREVAEGIRENVLNSRDQKGAPDVEVQVSAHLFRATTDPSDGSLIEIMSEGDSAVYPQLMTPRVSSFNKPIRCERFMEELARESKTSGRFLYSLPLAPVYRSDTEPEVRYLPRILLLCSEVTATPRALTMRLTSGLLGTRLQLNELLVLPVRLQLG